MKVVIIGKNGQLAQAIKREYLKYKFSLSFFSRKEIDILDERSIRIVVEKEKPDIIINTSGIHANIQLENNPSELFSINAIAVGKLAKVAHDYGLLFLTLSTNYVFDGKSHSPYIETDKPNPLQYYGVSKLAGEYLAQNLNLDNTYIVRTSGIFGGEGSPEKGNFILRILKEAKETTELYVSREQYMSLTYADDLAFALLKMIKNKPPSGLFHLVNEGYGSMQQYAEEIVRLANIKCKIIGIDKKGVSDGVLRPVFSVLKNTTAKKNKIQLPNYQESLSKYVLTLKKRYK